MLLGYNSPSLYYKNLEYGVDQTIYCYDTAKAMSEAAVKAEKTARIHIALDTGMTRIGLSPDEKGLAIVKQIAELPNIKIEGLFTHLSCADTTDKAYTESQMKRYDSFVELLDEAEIEIPVRHICNSAAIMEYDDHRYDMARAGIILYGLYPSDEVDFSNLELTPCNDGDSLCSEYYGAGDGAWSKPDGQRMSLTIHAVWQPFLLDMQMDMREVFLIRDGY